jgi:hypothetical protein|tara:strand:+ start:251 stop:505 length:255 start_codon:yes stop_codon:yes gene_type:complete
MAVTLEYAIINSGYLGEIDFSQICETSENTLRYNLDNNQFVIKYNDGDVPSFIRDGSVVPSSTMDHETVLELMSSPAWTSPDPV